MACKCRLNSNFGDFSVPNFTNQNDIWSLTKHRAEDRGKSKPDALPDLALVDAFEVVFHGVFGRNDLFVRAVEFIERGVERGGFSGSRGSSDQKDAVGSTDHPVEDFEVVRFKPEIGQADLNGVRTQNTKTIDSP